MEKIAEHNSVVSKKPFVNINGAIFYNPSDKARVIEKENMSAKDLQAAGKFTSNPQTIIITDRNLKDELKVILHI